MHRRGDQGRNWKRSSAASRFPGGGGRRSPYRLDTPLGTDLPPFPLLVSRHRAIGRRIEGTAFAARQAAPGGITGILDARRRGPLPVRVEEGGESGRSRVRGPQRIGSPLDVALSINGPRDTDGKRTELARNDDLPGTTDAGLDFTVPADGRYEIAVGRHAAGKSGSPARPSTGWTVRQPITGLRIESRSSEVERPARRQDRISPWRRPSRKGGFKGPIAPDAAMACPRAFQASAADP